MIFSKKTLTFCLVFIFVAFFDQFTKLVALEKGITSLNIGFSFGVGAWLGVVGQILTMIVSWMILALLFKKQFSSAPILFSVFTGSTFSNLVDRLRWGGVVDFLPLPFTSIHNNFADWGVTISIGWLLWMIVVDRKKENSI